MQKYFFILIFVQILYNTFSFDFKKYTPTKIDELINYITIKEDHEQLPNDKKIYKNTHAIDIKLKSYPDPISKSSEFEKDFFLKIVGLKEYSKLFNNELEILYNDIKIKFIFQKVLIEYLKKEVKINDTITLYCYVGMYIPDKKELYIMVNEFLTEEQKPKYIN